jgi:hypothetical protein
MLMDILEFHHVRDGVFETLNWAAMFASNMQKHALVMFFYEKK